MKDKLLLLFCIILLAIVPVNVSAEQSIKVNLNGNHIDFDVQPAIINGRTMVPLRAIFEALGLEIRWDGETSTVTGVGNGKEIKLKIGSTKALIDGNEVELDVPAAVIENRTLVPVRFVAEASGAKVAWDGTSRTVLISTLEKPFLLVKNPDEKIKIEYVDGTNIKFYPNTVNLPRDGECRVSLEGESNYEYLFVVIKGPDLSINRELLRTTDGKFKTDTWLRHGPGEYVLTVLGSHTMFGNYLPLAVIFVNNANYFWGKFDVPIQVNYLNDELIELSRDTLGTPYSTEFVHLSGTSLNRYLLVSIVKDGEEITEPIKIREGKFDFNVWLKYGPGYYDIYIYGGNFLDADFKKVLAIEAESSTDDSRFVLPSITVESDNEEIIQLAREITEGKETEIEKVLAIHDWVATKINYDTKSTTIESFNIKSALDTYRTRTGVCNDFAELAAALCRSVGIPARIAVGEAGNDEDGWVGHAWNEVYVEGKWIIMDPTWDAGYIRGHRFRDALSHEYFNPSIEKFNKDHKFEKYLQY